jgi:uncharacterized delta-60 repeat protein
MIACRRLRLAPLFLAPLAAGGAAAQDDGDLDPRWGASGVARVTAPSPVDPTDIACAADGYSYIAYQNGGSDFAITRITPAGLFSGGSSAAFDLGGANLDIPQTIAAGADGKVAVAGFASDATAEAQVAAARFEAQLTGGLDELFSTDGKATQNFMGTAVTTAVAVGPSGETVIGGCYQTGGAAGFDFFVLRLLSNGTPDNDFDGNGVRTIDFAQNTTGASDDCIRALVVQPDGMIVAAGSARFSADDYDFAVARFTTAGALDATFSPGGGAGAGMHTVAFDLGGTDRDEAYAVALDRFGRIVLAGAATGTPALARLTPLGAPDNSFDSEGEAVWNQSGTAIDVAVLAPPSNRILFASDAGTLVAFTEDGDPDDSFGIGNAIPIEDPAADSSGAPKAMTTIGGMPVVLLTSTLGADERYVAVRYWMDQIFGDDFESGNTNGWRGW